MVHRLLLFFLFVGFSLRTTAQTPDAEGNLVKWMTLQEALEKNSKQPRPIILDFYTDWCGWCKHMMKTTYANPGIAQYINTNFYPAKFNAEGKDTIEFLGKKYLPSGPEPKAPHELAVELLKGQLMYPSTLFLNGFEPEKNAFRLNMLAPGYLDAQKIEPILVYTLENAFRNASIDDFRDQYQKAFYDSTVEQTSRTLPWIDARSFFNNPNDGKKKSLVFINTEWCNSCKVMGRASFSWDSLRTYLLDKFNLVGFNAESKDTMQYQGKAYPGGKQFHSLLPVLGKNGFAIPMLCVLDEQGQLLDAIPSYVSPWFLRDIAHFYGDDFYRKGSWVEYQAVRYGKGSGQ